MPTRIDLAQVQQLLDDGAIDVVEMIVGRALRPWTEDLHGYDVLIITCLSSV